MNKILKYLALLPALVLFASCRTGDEDAVIAKPSNLRVEEATSETATLSWDVVKGATGYEVQIEDMGIENVTAPSYTATGLSPGTEYDWQVRTLTKDGQSEWVKGEVIKTAVEPLIPPTNLRITDTRGSRTYFEWDAPAEPNAEISGYEIDLGGEISKTTDPSFTATTLENEREYTWRVRSVSTDNLRSEWVDGEAFITGTTVHFLAPASSATMDFYGSFYEDMHELIINVVSYNWPVDGFNGFEFRTCFLAQPDLTKPIIDIPEGTYTFGSTKEPFYIDTNQAVTGLVRIDEGNATYSDLESGTVTVEGDHTNYTLTYEFLLKDGTEFYADYVGPIDIDNPAFMSTFFDDQEMETVHVYSGQYFEDAFDDGTADGYTMEAASQGMGLVSSEDGLGRYWIGTGWVVSGIQLHAPIGSGMPLPDGVYTIKNTETSAEAPWTVLPGYFYSTRKDLAGIWVRHFAGDNLVGMAPLVSGTIESIFSAETNSYTMEIDAYDDYGNHITGTMVGAGMS